MAMEANYVGSNQFSVDHDQTSRFTVSDDLRLLQGAGNCKVVIITAAIYDAKQRKTYVTVSPAIVIEALVAIENDTSNGHSSVWRDPGDEHLWQDPDDSSLWADPEVL
jgi:hypothetical protein